MNEGAMRILAAAVILAPAVLPFTLLAQTKAPTDWVARSNENARVLIDARSRFYPESASSEGVTAFDTETTSLNADNPAKVRAATLAAQTELAKRFETEKDRRIKQDLEILVDAADRQIRNIDADAKTFLPYTDVAGLIFEGERTLLDDQAAESRRAAALVRLRKYAGIEPGFTPLTTQAEERYREKASNKALLGPAKQELEQDLRNASAYVDGIGLLLEKQKLKGYEEPLAKLRQQIAEYGEFVRKEVMPRSRTDFRLPPAIYQLNLENYGVDYTPEDLSKVAHQGFTEIQREMGPIAARIARARKLPAADYRSVIRVLKKEQFSGDEILPKYREVLKQIEQIVRDNHLLTLPERPAIISIASAAETAQQPAPHMKPPPLLNNHGERGRFVLPLATKGADGVELKYDDFTFAAAAWTLTAHEARPGHELQFDAMVERGVSLARALFAFNSTNVEGWGLYAEAFLLPYMPDEGKLISLQFRLLRAARAFLDPELQAGKITPEQAMKVLENDVVVSKAFATEEVERFTFRMPGQAVAYYDGFTRLQSIRWFAEKALGKKFNAQRFHDFVLAQGLLPTHMVWQAVTEEFLPSQVK
jgi:uncharacterized protein (DUF885 family)